MNLIKKLSNLALCTILFTFSSLGFANGPHNGFYVGIAGG